jgi:predicted Zn-dependent protease
MAKRSTGSGKTSSATASTVSPSSKAKTYVVSHPLTPSRISWLRQQSRHVAEVSNRYRDERKT